MTSLPRPRFDAAAFQSGLATRQLGRFLVYRPEVDTTMLLARREANEGAPHGTLVLAERQTAGRGRRGRTFHSPDEENLYFTLVLRCGPAQHERLAVAVPVAVCLACRQAGVDARIKWPNDIWASERKLCGMLIDAEVSGADVVALAGVGINVNGDPTLVPELAAIATSLQRELGRPVDRESLLAGVCNELESALERPAAQLLETYRQLSLVLGRRVLVAPLAAEPYEALAAAIGHDGALVVEKDDGSRETVLAADVSLRPAGS
jgi:BirA family biotin operon repressor/biotin-[acetyl-CoA-carboxylase] ligase